jgi:hypothetical protein
MIQSVSLPSPGAKVINMTYVINGDFIAKDKYISVDSPVVWEILLRG